MNISFYIVMLENVDLAKAANFVISSLHFFRGNQWKKIESIVNTSAVMLGWDRNTLSMCHNSLYQQLT